MKKLLTTFEMAEALRVNVWTVRRYASQGLIPSICINGRVKLFDEDAVMQALQNVKNGVREPEPEPVAA